jgi:glyoxylase-like metal-dependent hydrolase (beta-lactamase superfamily II)
MPHGRSAHCCYSPATPRRRQIATRSYPFTLETAGAIDLGGGRRLDSHYTPGHARHHVGLIDPLSGDLYVGDAADVYIPDNR